MLQVEVKHYRCLGMITVLYVAMQLISNVTAGKIISLCCLPVSVTVIYFPITYIFADILVGKVREFEPG